MKSIFLLITFTGLSNFLIPGGTDKFDLHVTITQNGTSTDILKTDSNISLKKEEFAILFNALPYDEKNRSFYATRIVFSLDAADLNYIKPGASFDDIPYLAPGSGFACARNEQYNFYSVRDGHQYIMYEENDKRAALVSQSEGVLRLQCDVKGFYQSMDVPVNKFAPSLIYLIVVSDMNLNNTIDEDEFSRITIQFD